jgi:UDP-glucuronate 4-epimerase
MAFAAGNKVLVTGAAGFIGFHTCKKLVDLGFEVTGFDNVNDYYDTSLKWARLRELGVEKEDKVFFNELTTPNFKFVKGDLADRTIVDRVFKEGNFDAVINLAAQAGVRYSLTNPQVYVDSNITGFVNILEGCRSYPVKHLVFASTSSVYGLNGKLPFSVKDNTDHPISLYASSKKANELLAHSYSHLFGIPCTGLRFFSVYGPWGRPDMALFIFVKNILEGKPIDVYNNGQMKRDFTYVEDIVNGIYNVMQKPPVPNPDWDTLNPETYTSSAPYKIMNIGNQSPVELLDFITEIENNLNKKAIKNMLPMQAGDVPANIANVDELVSEYNYKPSTPVKTGVKNFVDWYMKFYHS